MITVTGGTLFPRLSRAELHELRTALRRVMRGLWRAAPADAELLELVRASRSSAAGTSPCSRTSAPRASDGRRDRRASSALSLPAASKLTTSSRAHASSSAARTPTTGAAPSSSSNALTAERVRAWLDRRNRPLEQRSRR